MREKQGERRRKRRGGTDGNEEGGGGRGGDRDVGRGREGGRGQASFIRSESLWWSRSHHAMGG